MSKTLIIAEAGVNHNGDVNIAKQLCLAAKEAGADVVKFQTWITERIITKDVQKAEYQVTNTGSAESQFDMLKRLELTYEEFADVREYCENIGIQFASTADEESGLDFLVDLGIPFIKVGSGDIGNISFLRYVGSQGLPVVLSTGMSTLEDVEKSIHALRKGGAKDITLLHCTTSYPCSYEDVNLNAMDTLRDTFGLAVGYSDHTQGVEVPIAAVAKGATIIEKHFTLNREMEGPDHIASTEPGEFKEMVDAIRCVEKALGSNVKRPTKTEKDISKVVLKRIVAKRGIKAGEVIAEEDICVKRSTDGISCKEWDSVVGACAIKDFHIDEGIILRS